MEEIDNDLEFFDEEVEAEPNEMDLLFEESDDQPVEKKSKAKKTKKVSTRRLIERIEEENRLRKEWQYLEDY